MEINLLRMTNDLYKVKQNNLRSLKIQFFQNLNVSLYRISKAMTMPIPYMRYQNSNLTFFRLGLPGTEVEKSPVPGPKSQCPDL